MVQTIENEQDFTARDGRTFRIFTSVPAEAPTAPLRTLYVLDANAIFAGLAQQAAVQAGWPLATCIDPMVIVGIGYPVAGHFDGARRGFDYTPPPMADTPQQYYPLIKTPMGGADRFLDLIEHEIMPMIEASLPASTAGRALFGHSFGGLFALHALFNRPHLFEHYVSLSPAIRWGLPALAESELAYRTSTTRPAGRKLMIAYGDLETRPGPREKEAPDLETIMRYRDEHAMAREVAALGTRLRSVPQSDLTCEVTEYPDESHMSLVPTALSRALRFVCRDGPP